MTDDVRVRRGAVLPSLLCALLVVLLVVVVALWRDRATADDGSLTPADVRGTDVVRAEGGGRAEEALRVARTATTRLFTVDHRRVGADVEQLLELTTDEFRDEYARDSQELRRRVEAQRLVISALVPADAVATEYLTTESAQVLVAVDVRTRGPRGVRRDRDYLTRVELELVDDTWLVAGIEQVQ